MSEKYSAVMKTDQEDKKRINVFLYFSAISANLATFGVGVAFAWSSPVIPKLNGLADPLDNPLKQPIKVFEETWIASLLPLGATVGPFLSGYLADKIGRKNTLLLSSLPMVVGFAFHALATDILHFFIGRILNGISAGAVLTVVPMYVGEIAESSNRGLLGCLFALFITVGNLFTYALGPYVTIRTFNLCCMVSPVLFVAVFGLLAPESPYHLVSKGSHRRARQSLLKLRYGDVDLMQRELAEVTKSVDQSFGRRGRLADFFRDRGVFKGICISAGLITFQQWSGVNFIFFYMQSIFEETGSSISSDVSVVIIGVVQFLAAAAAALVVDRLGRRILLLTSAAGLTASLVVFGAFFHMKAGGRDVGSLFWLPTASIVTFVLTYMFGFGPIAFATIGELFPPHVKSTAATVTIFLYLVCTFGTTTLFPHVIEAIGMAAAFWLLAGVCVVGGVFVYFFVPETKGKTLLEIQELLKE